MKFNSVSSCTCQIHEIVYALIVLLNCVLKFIEILYNVNDYYDGVSVMPLCNPEQVIIFLSFGIWSARNFASFSFIM